MTIFSTQFCLQYLIAGSYSTDIMSSIRQACSASGNCYMDYRANTKTAILQHVSESIAHGGIMPMVCLFRVYECLSEVLGYSYYIQVSG